MWLFGKQLLKLLITQSCVSEQPIRHPGNGLGLHPCLSRIPQYNLTHWRDNEQDKPWEHFRLKGCRKSAFKIPHSALKSDKLFTRPYGFSYSHQSLGFPGSEQEKRGRRNDREKVSRKSNQGLATMLSIPATQESKYNKRSLTGT